MNDIGVEQNPLERWLSRQRKPVILSPEKEPVKMKWEGVDANHWADFRKLRYMLEATADLLLMYACTNTFFLLEPFSRFDSTPIEVYARELGNEVPRYLSVDNNAAHIPLDTEPQHHSNKSQTEELKKAPVDEESEKYCSPEDVIRSVTVSYSEEYVISQLLQWFNLGMENPTKIIIVDLKLGA